jgi:cytochrome c oxidase cbb3-type subunit III
MGKRSHTLTALAGAVLLLLPAMGCEREERRLRELPPATARPQQEVRLIELQPGPPTANLSQKGPYDNNAQGISEGKRLYQAYNCSGCHAQGGGDIGPAFLDTHWIYGNAPENIFSSIAQGRPNGMPAYGAKVPAYQIWQLVAFVRSMGRLVPKAAASGRSDHMNARPSEQSLDFREPEPVQAKEPGGRQ